MLLLPVSLENKMMNTIFRRRIPNSTNLGYVNINYRQYVVALLSTTFCLRRPRHELWRKVAMRRFNREIDMSFFVRKQLMLTGFVHGMTNLG